MTACVLLLAGCGVTRVVEIEQGRVGLPELVAGIEGKTKIQVRNLLGPPQSRWELDNEVWLYYRSQIKVNDSSTFFAEVHFDADSKVARVHTRVADNE